MYCRTQVYSSDFCTVDNVIIDVEYDKFDRTAWNKQASGGYSGHHAIALKLSRSILVKNWQVRILVRSC